MFSYLFVGGKDLVGGAGGVEGSGPPGEAGQVPRPAPRLLVVGRSARLVESGAVVA